MITSILKTDGPSLRQNVLRQARMTPNAPALAVRGFVFSYRELEDMARRWAESILMRLEQAPERVGVFAYRSATSYVGTLATLMMGATFVPLNPTFPYKKTAAMIEFADLDVIIADTTAVSQLRQVVKNTDLLLFIPDFEDSKIGDGLTRVIGKSDVVKIAANNDWPPITPDMTAYLLFTSGSTGEPKGVPVTHGNVLHFISIMSARYRIGVGDRLSQTFDQTFDLSIFDIFMAWSNGACVCSMATVDLLAPIKFVNENEITVWFSVPSVPAQMLNRKKLQPGTMPGLRWSLFCGEPLTMRSAEAWQAAAPHSIVENLYGPTEVTIACTVHRWNQAQSPQMCRNDIVPIGKPLDGLTTILVDENMHPVRAGEVGELFVAGPQTTLGYWNDVSKTVERYIDFPIGRHEKRRFYRTGDHALLLNSGEYVFIGRADTQVKILGHRVELGEIEAALRQDSNIEHVVAIPWPLVEGGAQGIVAFVTGSDLDVSSLLAAAKASLPAYMLPKQIIVLPEMPFNANGKIDRRKLRDQLADLGKKSPG